ncbi:MAG: PAS domain-containing protein, partial [Desulfomonile sp.]
MTQEKDSKNNFSVLRSQAEELLGPVSVDQEDISALSPEEAQVLVHDLRIHQIELEMQNEELRQAQIKLEELKDKYLDLYDFAPVGYMTLNDRGLILEANLTAVGLLGMDRTSLIKMFFSRFVCQEFTDTFYLYLQQVFQSQSKQACEIKLTRKDGTVFYAQLESIPVQDENGQFNRCRAVLTDITERKLMEEELKKSEERYRG